MKKLDEIALYAYMREVAGMMIAHTDAAADELGINRKRAHTLVEKWLSHGWCNGVSTRCVSFAHDAPAALLTWGVVQ